MEKSTLHEDLMIIDQLNEGIDWFTFVSEANQTIAKRIKATPTDVLVRLTCGDMNESIGDAQKFQVEFAKRELAQRKADGNINPNGDSYFAEQIAGYDKFDKTIHEVLSSDDPVEKWIADFVKSDNPKFDGKTKKERINMALGAFYAAQKKNETLQEKRDFRIVSLATKSTDENIIKFFIESAPEIATKAVLNIKDLYEDFVFDLAEAAITVGSTGNVKCIQRWGACAVGKVYEGIWKPSARPNQLKLDLDAVLPGATSHPIIFFDKNTNQLTLPKQFELL